MPLTLFDSEGYSWGCTPGEPLRVVNPEPVQDEQILKYTLFRTTASILLPCLCRQYPVYNKDRLERIIYPVQVKNHTLYSGKSPYKTYMGLAVVYLFKTHAIAQVAPNLIPGWPVSIKPDIINIIFVFLLQICFGEQVSKIWSVVYVSCFNLCIVQ